MHRQTGCIIFAILILSTAQIRAESEIERLLKSGDYKMIHNIQLIPREKTDEENRIGAVGKNLSKKDRELAYAISKATVFAKSFRPNTENQVVLDIESAYLLIEQARWQYNLRKPRIPFVLFVKKIIDKRYNCSEKWIRYYKAFLK